MYDTDPRVTRRSDDAYEVTGPGPDGVIFGVARIGSRWLAAPQDLTGDNGAWFDTPTDAIAWVLGEHHN